MITQLTVIISVIAWPVVSAFILFSIIKNDWLRVNTEEEEKGLDIGEPEPRLIPGLQEKPVM